MTTMPNNTELPQSSGTLHTDDGYYTWEKGREPDFKHARIPFYTGSDVRAAIEADRATRAQAERPALTGWLPVDGAPKDGSEVLLRCVSNSVASVANGYWLQSAYGGVGAWIWPYIHKTPMYYMPMPPLASTTTPEGS